MLVAYAPVFLALFCARAFASPIIGIDLGAWETGSASPAAMPPSGTLLTVAEAPAAASPASAAEKPAAPAKPTAGSHLRQLLSDFAVTLQNIRYRRGGREPSTGFDCSGFVRYVFRHAVDQDLPADSASQFASVGAKVSRAELKTGDLVFFRTRGKRISHVGIYLGEGRFIHSPSSGKRVSINRLDETYWARRFAGAKRPEVLS
jgi:cell wall-associated NlpC family hydrolase